MTGPDAPSHLQLLAAWRSGDRAASDQLVRRHYAAVKRLFELECPREADDLAQQTFLAAVQGQHRFRADAASSIVPAAPELARTRGRDEPRRRAGAPRPPRADAGPTPPARRRGLLPPSRLAAAEKKGGT